MNVHGEIKEALRKLVGQSVLPILGIVQSVEGDSCTIEVAGSLTIPGVRLKASVDDQKDAILVTPKEKSNVIAISLTGELDDLFVVKCDAWDKIEIIKDKLEVIIDGEDSKLSVKNASVSLKDLFDMNSDILSNMQVLTSQGPSVKVAPATIIEIEKFKLKYKQLLK